MLLFKLKTASASTSQSIVDHQKLIEIAQQLLEINSDVPFFNSFDVW